MSQERDLAFPGVKKGKVEKIEKVPTVYWPPNSKDFTIYTSVAVPGRKIKNAWRVIKKGENVDKQFRHDCERAE